MTGPEHYRVAEALLRAAGEYSATDPAAVAMVQRADVHAKLAIAAATAIQPASYAMPRTFAANRNEELAWVAACASTPSDTTKDAGGIETVMPKGYAL